MHERDSSSLPRQKEDEPTFRSGGWREDSGGEREREKEKGEREDEERRQRTRRRKEREKKKEKKKERKKKILRAEYVAAVSPRVCKGATYTRLNTRTHPPARAGMYRSRDTPNDYRRLPCESNQRVT
ncbi:hypothetical protein PUN28_018309 [Cardiocondyla obscurior]|uniref:Uncharacterized protein n=1 Tax=Cardiocondyla obscurior TaxID=286306 RepID=A0AAW2EGT8_9HYME